MPIKTPTSSESPGDYRGEPAAAGGLDLAGLAALANEFYRQLPGDAPSFAAVAPSAQGQIPSPEASALHVPDGVTSSLPPNPAWGDVRGTDLPYNDQARQFAPDVAPGAAALGAHSDPAQVKDGAPAFAPTLGPSLPAASRASVSAANAPHLAQSQQATALDQPSPTHGLPSLGATRPAVGDTPYFLAERATLSAQTPARPAYNGDSVDYLAAQPFALPGSSELDRILAQIVVGVGVDDRPPAQPSDLHNASPAWLPADYTRHPVPALGGVAPIEVNAVRRDFPILSERVHGKQLVWFDNAATTQKPKCVIDRLTYYYEHENSNIHRAAHDLAARATDAYEGARNTVARFIGAASPEEIIFVRGTTEGINLIANTWGKANLKAGDEIILSHLEHHANIVPWQMIAAQTGARIRVIPVDDDGQLLLDAYYQLLSPRTKIVSVTQVSNALGTVTPIPQIIAGAHSVGAVALVDGAQSVSHMRTNVQALDADFLVFSGHKIYAPTGIGAVYGKKALLEAMPPYQGGGNMIADVTFEHTVYHGPPTRFEAGTGNIADAVGLGAALDYVEWLGIENIAVYEHALLEYAQAHMRTVPGLRMIGTAHEKASVLSFVLAGYTTEEVGKALNEEGIAVRSGHHCAQPILRRFGVETTVRPSLAFYNTCEEVDLMIKVLKGLAKR